VSAADPARRAGTARREGPTLDDLRVEAPVRTLLVVFGDQLAPRAGVLQELDAERDALLLVEVEGESRHVPSGKQRTVLFLSAMRHFSLEQARTGRRVHHVRLDEPGNAQSLRAELERQVERLAPERLLVVQPGEWRVLRAVEELAERTGVPVAIREDPHFTCSIEQFRTWRGDRRRPLMEHFYRWQRRRLGILLDEDGGPVGGRWNHDHDNREAFRERPRLRRPYTPRPDAITREVMELVRRRLPEAPGGLEAFRWPVTRAQARRALADFVEHRLARFGTHQDAMWTGEPFVNHSLLSSSLNLKLLDPREVVEAALRAHEDGRAPTNSVEGFVRQVVGWREFVRGIYWTEGEDYAERNALAARGRLPRLYWDADTDMTCLRESVTPVLEHGYSHHVQRLMITGNFALLSGVDPQAVSDWYLGLFVDGVDWVTLPNALGMVMHADGGVVGTKPYAASGKYVDRMSNYCASCPHEVRKRSGEGACPFNVLYWDFLAEHAKRLRSNHRMRMVLANLDRMPAEELRAIRAQARSIRASLGVQGRPD
jgi:deoxyribodipyrimidine photolyase-related protein